MENLRTETVKMQVGKREKQFNIREKDFGDQIVFDISVNEHYLLTLAKDGSILFMNFDAPDQEREVFKLSYLNQLIQVLPEMAVQK